jgi:RNA polymerase sigma-70 factor, ECF subfamily
MTVDMMSAELNDEIALVRLAQLGSTESFEILVNRYEQGIYRLVHVITKNKQDADDVLQETFLKAYANIHQFGGESRFYTWLAGIAMNGAAAKLQLRQVLGWIPFDEAPIADDVMSTPGDVKSWRHNPEDSYSEPELFAILCKALEDIETPFRAVFALCDMERFSDQETASVLEIPLETVRSRLTRARLKLRKNLSVWFAEPSIPATGENRCESVGHILGLDLVEGRECT